MLFLSFAKCVQGGEGVKTADVVYERSPIVSCAAPGLPSNGPDLALAISRRERVRGSEGGGNFHKFGHPPFKRMAQLRPFCDARIDIIAKTPSLGPSTPLSLPLALCSAFYVPFSDAKVVRK